MRRVAVLAVRELWAWRALGWVALALALLVVSAPLLPGLGAQELGDVRGAFGLILAAVLVAGAALVVGMSFLGRELAEGRLGFYLALPARSWEIGLGKLAGAALAVYGAGLVVLAPTLLLDGRPPLGALAVADAVLMLGRQEEAAWNTALWLPLFLILVAHWLGVALRARSLWLVLDLGALAISGVVVWSVATWLGSQLAPGALSVVSGVAAALVLLGLLLAPWAQIAHGRALLPRAHRAQSLVAGTGLLLAATAALGWQTWLRSGQPADLVKVGELRAAPAGDWLMVGGRLARRADFSPSFLFHPPTSVSRSVGVAGGRWGLSSLVLFSPDGTEALVRRAEGQWWSTPSELRWLRLGDGGIEERATGLELDPRGWTIAALDRGHLAVWGEGRLSVYALTGGATLAAFRVPSETWGSYLGIHGGAVRLLRVGDDGASLQAWSLELGERRLREHPRQPLPRGSWEVAAVEPASGRALLLRRDRTSTEGERARLHDLATGELVAELPLAGRPLGTRFLPGGRALIAAALSPGVRLCLFSPEGEEILALPDLDRRLLAGLGVAPETLSQTVSGHISTTLGWLWHPERVSLAVGSWWQQDAPRVHLLEADLERGSWRAIGPDLLPVMAGGGGHPALGVGSPGSRTFWRPARGELVRLDPDSAEPQVLLATAAAL